jgi:hypothetical protein
MRRFHRVRNVLADVVLITSVVVLAACSTHVSSDRVRGSYVASYPFGTAKLTLESNGTFVQTVTIDGQAPATAKGSWNFDATDSTISLHGAMLVVDGFGHLKTHWREVEDLPEVPVELLWLRTEIESSESYPYVKL